MVLQARSVSWLSHLKFLAQDVTEELVVCSTLANKNVIEIVSVLIVALVKGMTAEPNIEE